MLEKGLFRAPFYLTKHVLLVFRFKELRGKDLNLRPLGYEPNELPLLHPAMSFLLYDGKGGGQRHKNAISSRE